MKYEKKYKQLYNKVIKNEVIYNHFQDNIEKIDYINKTNHCNIKNDLQKMVISLVNKNKPCYFLLLNSVDEFMNSNYYGYAIEKNIKNLESYINDIECKEILLYYNNNNNIKQL